MKNKIAVFWFRRDLRLEDNHGLFRALEGEHPVLPVFIFDKEILGQLPQEDARVTFIYNTLQALNKRLKEKDGTEICSFHGKPLDIFKDLIATYDLQGVYSNRDYEPYARKRDREVQKLLETQNIPFYTYKDQVIFEKNEVVKADGNPYLVYSPYMRKWKELFEAKPQLASYDPTPYFSNFYKSASCKNTTLANIGFEKSPIKIPPYNVAPTLIRKYRDTRNFPALVDGTSRLGPHLRFGTVSIRQLVSKAIAEEPDTFGNELIWREFFMQILWHFPEAGGKAMKPRYDRIQWRNNEAEFDKWKIGKTGFALVDAGMRELNASGYMHNRVRMLTASFLCKHLLIDWRWGEAYFAEKLLDYEMASNVGNWQWAAGSGVDAAPYFRIFNPMTQFEKFDKEKTYVRKWVPEYGTDAYPTQMVDHKEARERCLKVYQSALD